MPAQLRIEAPDQPPFAAWLQAEVVRIGAGELNADAAAEIAIEGLPRHLATVIFRQGGYWLANRSPGPLRLGRRTVLPGEVAAWRPDCTLSLECGLRITLLCQKDPRPVRCERWRPELTQQAFELERDERRRIRTNRQCFAVALIAVFLTSLMLHNRTASSPQADHAQTLILLDQVDHESDGATASIRNWLLSGYSSWRQGDPEQARQAYVEARDLVRSDAGAHLPPATRNAIMRYILDRIDAI